MSDEMACVEAGRNVFERDPFARLLGMELVRVGCGTAVVRMTVDEQHRNGVGTVHGGVLFSLADVAFAVAGNSRGVLAVALNVSITFVKGIRGGVIEAVAREVSLGPRVATYDVTVTDESGEPLALFHGLAYRKRQR